MINIVLSDQHAASARHASHATRASRTAGTPFRALIALLLALCLGLSTGLAGCSDTGRYTPAESAQAQLDLASIPSYTGDPYTVVNDNEPTFTADEITDEAFETYAPLDALGRCGTAFACVGLETMPTSERESISEIHPTGWRSSRYGFIDGESLYNRCHLIAHSLTAENANERNLITGTRYMNTEGMLPFEEGISYYVHKTKNHVLYRVTPIFEGNNLIASGVHMEGLSVEDNGEGVRFNVYCYNVQPYIGINYATGENWLDEDNARAEDSAESGRSGAADTGAGSAAGAGASSSGSGSGKAGANASSGNSNVAGAVGVPGAAGVATSSAAEATYVLNTNNRKFHLPTCDAVQDISDYNRAYTSASRDEVEAAGYSPCGRCKP